MSHFSHRVTIDRAVLAAVGRWPDAIAAEYGNNLVTYAQLGGMAGLVAEQLKSQGVVPGDRVALLCPRSVEGLSAVLGILLTGAVYVPISPYYPATRMIYIADDSASRLTIVDQSCANPCRKAHKSVDLQEILGRGAKDVPTLDIINRATADNDPSRPAYILYTSGSTGRPKGVVVPHSALMNTLAWMREAFAISAGESIPQKTPWGFTDSLWELLLPLLLGGKVSFIDEETVRNPVALYHELENCGAVITQFVPPALSTFLDSVCEQVESPSLPNLRWILNGGEELPRSLVDRWFSVFPNVGFANSYGMTESAIYASCYFMTRPPVWGMRRIPVGKPITNAEITILDGGGKVLGPDRVGEICVGGMSLMSGYWGLPELTAEVMVSHPETGALIYRTGDYGSTRYDGEVAYLGRRDHQVKIRGMRVELGEVERVLMQHPCVKQASVLTKGEGDAKALVAFYVVHSEDPGESAIVSHLACVLPNHMVPARCVKLDAIPMTAHSKTDRARLLQLPLPARVTRYAERAATGSIEAAIGRVWSDVLETDDFGVDDGFFAAGGNSLLLVKVYANLPADHQSVLTIPDLLQYPTIRALARKVEEELTGHPAADTGTRTPRRDPSALRHLRQESP